MNKPIGDQTGGFVFVVRPGKPGDLLFWQAVQRIGEKLTLVRKVNRENTRGGKSVI